VLVCAPACFVSFVSFLVVDPLSKVFVESFLSLDYFCFVGTACSEKLNEGRRIGTAVIFYLFNLFSSLASAIQFILLLRTLSSSGSGLLS
jgi:hypothetical protein